MIKLRLHKKAKYLLDLIISSAPTVGMGRKAYDTTEIANVSGFSEEEFFETYEHLEKEKCIKYADSNSSAFFLTSRGRHYKEFKWIDIKEFLMKSFLVPIAVAIITSIVTTAIYNWKNPKPTYYPQQGKNISNAMLDK